MLSVAVREGAGVVNEVERVTYCLGVCECAGCKESFAFECEYEFVSLCNMLIAVE